MLSKGCAASRSTRARRARMRSICAAAAAIASTSTCGSLLSPANACPSSATARANSGTLRAQCDNPCRRAFCAERFFPPALIGPVLLRAFCAERIFPAAVRGPLLLAPLRATRSLPAAVFGPVLFCALARLAASLAALIIPAPARERSRGRAAPWRPRSQRRTGAAPSPHGGGQSPAG